MTHATQRVCCYCHEVIPPDAEMYSLHTSSEAMEAVEAAEEAPLCPDCAADDGPACERIWARFKRTDTPALYAPATVTVGDAATVTRGDGYVVIDTKPDDIVWEDDSVVVTFAGIPEIRLSDEDARRLGAAIVIGRPDPIKKRRVPTIDVGTRLTNSGNDEYEVYEIVGQRRCTWIACRVVAGKVTTRGMYPALQLDKRTMIDRAGRGGPWRPH